MEYVYCNLETVAVVLGLVNTFRNVTALEDLIFV